jgi:hypothetical protein
MSKLNVDVKAHYVETLMLRHHIYLTTSCGDVETMSCFTWESNEKIFVDAIFRYLFNQNIPTRRGMDKGH